jgi:hypothetical protein
MIDLDAGETVTCTYTETKAIGTIRIQLDSVPNDPQDFDFGYYTPSGIGIFILDDDTDPQLSDVFELSDVEVGAYEVSLNSFVPAGWQLTGLTCSDPDGGTSTNLGTSQAMIDLDAGETVTCTYTETAQRPIITIVKDAVPDAKRDFSFTGDLGDFDLDDDGSFRNPSPLPRQRSFGGALGTLGPGTYTVRERAAGGSFYLTNLVCNDPDGGTTINLANRRVDIDVDWGENITCTFTNSQTTLVIIEDAVPDAAKDFSFIGSGDVPDFDLDDDETLRNPSSLKRERAFGGIAPGAYPIRQRQVNGWPLTSISCVDPDGGTTTSLGNRRANIDLDPGETVVCTFTNTRS